MMQFLEKLRKMGDITLVTTEAIRNYLVSEPNNYTTNLFSENLLVFSEKNTTNYEKARLFRCINIRYK